MSPELQVAGFETCKNEIFLNIYIKVKDRKEVKTDIAEKKITPGGLGHFYLSLSLAFCTQRVTFLRKRTVRDHFFALFINLREVKHWTNPAIFLWYLLMVRFTKKNTATKIRLLLLGYWLLLE